MSKSVALAMLILATLTLHAGMVLADVDWNSSERNLAGAAYYRAHANVRLGAQQRLPNGVAWRLLTDAKTRLAMPRITWMPDIQGMGTANRLFDVVHGSLLEYAAQTMEEFNELDENRRSRGDVPLSVDYPVVQTEVRLTYASSKLAGMVDTHYTVTEGHYYPEDTDALTFDLLHATIFGISACSGSNSLYGDDASPKSAARYRMFRFGEILKVCDGDSLRDFIRILREHAKKAAAGASDDRHPFVTQCIENFRNPTGIDESSRLRLYLTFKGLAVQVAFDHLSNADNSACTFAHTALNPIIIPYVELEPFMQPGPWRDEFLKSH